MIRYKAGYKYRLEESYLCYDRRFPLGVELGACRHHVLMSGRYIVINAGYAWDGPSGPAFDTKSFMRASLVHDALYQLMREGVLPLEFRKTADQIMRDICREDGMWWPRRTWCYWAVRLFAGKAAAVGGGRPVLTAP